MAKWIDAKKRSPKKDGNYLVFYTLCDSKGKAWPYWEVGRYEVEDKSWRETSWEHGCLCPTHWMRLPSPPAIADEKETAQCSPN